MKSFMVLNTTTMLTKDISGSVKYDIIYPLIQSYIPDPFKLREFVTCTPPGNERLFCTMVRHGEETSGGHYTLYLEYLGGLIPLLKGKRASKLRPDFVVYDPKIKTKFNPDGKSIEYLYALNFCLGIFCILFEILRNKNVLTLPAFISTFINF